MSKPRSIGLLAGLFLAGIGLGLTWQGLRVTPSKVRHIRAKQDRLAKLADIRADLGQAEQGFKAFADSDNRMLLALPVVFEDLLPDTKPEFAEFEPSAAPHDTKLQTVNVNVGLMELKKLNPLLEKLESADPPWRIVECRISAAPTRRGWGNVTLSLEGLEKF